MDPVLMEFFIEDEDDGELQQLLDNTSLSKYLLKNEEDIILKQIQTSCLELACGVDGFKSLHSYTSDYGHTYLENGRPRKRVRKPRFHKFSNSDEFIASDIEDDEIQKYIRSFRKKNPNGDDEGECSRKRILEVRMANPFENSSDEEFFHFLRVTRPTYLYLVGKVKEYKVFFENYAGANVPILPEQAVQMFLYYMGQRCTYKFLSNMYHMSESAVMSSIMKCVDVVNRLDDKEVFWPTNEESVRQTEEKFKLRSGFPGIVGSVGGCCIAMRTNKDPPAGYKIGKLKSILYLLAVTNPNHTFNYVQAGFPGTFSLQEAYESSTLSEAMKANVTALFAIENTYLIGNSEFILDEHLMVPFPQAGISDAQKVYNEKLLASSTCERTFALLKNRFLTLQTQIYGTLIKIPHIIKACCIIHNICAKDPKDEEFLCKNFTNNFDNFDDCREDNDFAFTPTSEEAFAFRDALAVALSKQDS